jgi:antitoxin (DNA-binding transcriptional repressor) of toxin-antitoxin stability system
MLVWIDAGEEVAITMRQRVVARLVPWPQKKAVKPPMPHIAARLKKVFGAKTIAFLDR